MANRTNSMAVVSVVSGAVGWMGVPLVASVVAIIAGHVARRQIRQTGEEGDGFAIIGLVLGYAHILLVCVSVGLIFLIYGGIFAFLAANGFSQH